jgi:hypothetical protein
MSRQPSNLKLDSVSSSGRETIPSPTWADVERVIRRLDGEAYSEASLGSGDEDGLFVVGGPDRYVLWIQRWDETEHELIIATASDPSPPAGSMTVTLSNDQQDEIPLARTVDRLTVTRAARAFLADQSLDADSKWER